MYSLASISTSSLTASSTSYNIAIGGQSLYTTSGSSNVALGYSSGRYSNSSNELYIDNQSRADNNGEKARGLIYGQFNSTLSNQKLYLNAGNVGISMSGNIATAKLHVHEPTGSNNYIKITNNDTTSSVSRGLDIGLTTLEKSIIWNYEPTSLALATNNLERITITSGGTVGINNTNPDSSYKLHICGDTKTDRLWLTSNNFNFAGNSEKGFISNESNNKAFTIVTQSIDRFVVQSDGKISIGYGTDVLTAATAMLDVNGDVNIKNGLNVTGDSQVIGSFSATQIVLNSVKLVTSNNIILSGDILNGGTW
jgi:hypothetical protein